MYKLLLVVCAQALVQSISAQCIGAGFADGLGWGGYGLGGWGGYGGFGGCGGCGGWGGWGGYEGWGGIDGAYGAAGFGVGALAASNGGGLMVTSASPMAPTGVSMTSENAYEGPLAVCGAVPFLGAVALEGLLPTVGAGEVSYGCGNGAVAIVEEDAGFAGPLGYDGFAGYDRFGYDGFAGYGGRLGGCDGFAGFAGPIGYEGYGGYGGCGCGCGGWY